MERVLRADYAYAVDRKGRAKWEVGHGVHPTCAAVEQPRGVDSVRPKTYIDGTGSTQPSSAQASVFTSRANDPAPPDLGC